MESIRGADVFIVQSCAGPNTNDHLWELLTLIDAAKLASANRITAVMPWFPYSRQDKKSAPREPITAKLLASCLEVAGADRVLTMDLHAGQIQGFFSIPVDHMTALPLFAKYYRDKGLWGDGVVAVAPDPGRGKMTTRFAQFLEADVAYMSKTRPDHDVAEVTAVVGRERVQGQGGDPERRPDRHRLDAHLGRQGAPRGGRDRRLRVRDARALPGVRAGEDRESEMTEICVTDTVMLDPTKRPANVQILPVAGLLADTIQNVFSGESVSEIFAGENQLF